MNKQERELFKHLFSLDQAKALHDNFIYQANLCRSELTDLKNDLLLHKYYSYYYKMFGKHIKYAMIMTKIIKDVYGVDVNER